MNAAPTIQSLGPPPDLHAERIVRAMLEWAHADRARMHENAKGALDLRQMGTPTGQWRAVERFRKAAGDSLLDIHLHRAKRGKFVLVVTDWQIFDPAGVAEKGDR